jgi:hypothetical protein
MSSSKDDSRVVLECSLRVAGLSRALHAEVATCWRSLPLAPVEPPSILFSPMKSVIGKVNVASLPPSEALSVRCLDLKLNSGRAVCFAMIATGCADEDAAALSTLASIVTANAVIQPAADEVEANASAATSPHDRHVHLAYAPYPALNAVFISPISVPRGSRVMLVRLTVAGCDVPLGSVPVQVTVPYNHSLAAKGRVYAAAEAGDTPALMFALKGGASTEEIDEKVRGEEWKDA